MATLNTHSEFVELTAYWKNNSMHDESSENPSTPTEELLSRRTSEEPQVRVHRNGTIIESIEFQCSCGKSAIVHLKYDEQ